MVVNKAQKIFIEPDEEIVFTVEKIFNAQTDRLILIIPHSAVLTSSAVSLKILASQLSKIDKLVVLVTDDVIAKQLAGKAKLAVENKISDVDKDTWFGAKVLKDEVIVEKTRVRNELLKLRQEKVGEDSHPTEIPQVVLNEKVKAVLEPESEKNQKNNATNLPVISYKPRLKGKVVDINGIKLFAGGDIIENEELLQMERDKKGLVENITLNNETELNINQNNMNDQNLVGIDMTDQLPNNEVYKPVNKRTPQKVLKGAGNVFAKIKSFFSMKKVIIGVVVVVVLYVLVSFLFLTSVNISVKFKQDDLTIKKSITAKTDATSPFDVATLTIKSDPMTKSNTASTEIETTGKGQTGEYAQGQLLVVNPGTTAINIKLGQVFSYNYLATPLKYTAIAAVTIDPASSKTISVKAGSFGEIYNVEDTLKNFIPEGLSNTVTAQNITKMSGGTTKEVKAVSKEDIDAIKQTLLDKLKTDLTTNLKTLLSDQEIILTGSEKFKEETFTTSSKLGDVADKFSAELKLTITAIKINKTLVKSLLQDVQKNEAGYSKVVVKDPVIENIVISGTTASFDAKANANAFNDLDLNSLKNDIKGKSVTEAKDYIKSKPGVSEVIIRYSPSFIPLNYQSIPNDDKKINIYKVD